MMNKKYKLLLAIIISLLFYLVSLNFFNETQSRLVGIISLLVTLWSNNALSLGVTSLLPIILFPLFGVLEASDVASNYSKTTIFLFIGGFLLAIATEKSGLHKRLARKLLAIFPSTPRGVLLSLMFTAGLLSAILSDTTTALLIIPIAGFLTTNKNFRFRLLLGVAYSCLIGGVLTPIGTPPNLILQDFLETNNIVSIGFATWSVMMFPLCLVMLIVACEVLLFGFKKENFVLIELEEQDLFMSKEQKKLILILISLAFVLILNPLSSHFFGVSLNEKLTLLSFGLLLFFPKVELLKWNDDFSKIPFAIIFLFGAGFCIAMAFNQTSLALRITDTLNDFSSLSPIVLMLIVSSSVVFATEITSNTALTSIMLPIIYPFALQNGLDPTLFMMLVAVSASYAFMLPIATPPNAIAMATGDVSTSKMLRRGFFLNIFGIFFTFLVAYFYWDIFLI